MDSFLFGGFRGEIREIDKAPSRESAPARVELHMTKTHTLFSSLAIGMLVSGASVAAFAAQDVSPQAAQYQSEGKHKHGKRGKCGHGPKTPETLIERYDANEDGVLQLTELPERKRERMAAADTDQDGTLSVAELQTFIDARVAEKFAKKDENGDGFIVESEVGEHKWERFVKADTNGDAKISLEEFQAAKAAGTLGHGKHKHKHGKRGKRGHGASYSKLLDRFDANENQQLEMSELPERMQQRIGSVDTNEDGIVSKDEFKATRVAKRAERFAKKDTNGDGALTEDEVSERRWSFVSKADTNEDGAVTQQELIAAFESGAMKRPERHKR